MEENERDKNEVPLPLPPSTPSREHPFLARLVSNDRLTPTTHFQDVRLVTFDIQGSGIRYDSGIGGSWLLTGCELAYICLKFDACSHCAGDVLMVQPQNISSAVDEFLSLLQLDPHQQFVLEQNDPGTHSYSFCMP